MADNDNIIDIRDVTFEREGTFILRGVSWKVAQGEHWAMLGANGSGKTTLLKIVTGYEWPSSGGVSILGSGFEVRDVRALRKRMGWVSSSLMHRFAKDHTGRMIVLAGIDSSIGMWREFSGDEHAAAQRALESVGGGALADKPWEILSQGERQRVLIARALVNHPALLILDEPCAGLDPVAREDFLDDVAAMARGDHAPTIVLVTHHIEEIRPFVTHTVVIEGGRVLASGPTSDVLRGDVLEAAFGRPCEVVGEDGRYRLKV